MNRLPSKRRNKKGVQREISKIKKNFKKLELRDATTCQLSHRVSSEKGKSFRENFFFRKKNVCRKFRIFTYLVHLRKMRKYCE